MPKREYGKVDDRLAGSVDRLALARAINELPPGYRTIFLMHEVQGYEHQEIAELLGCSVGNSKSQLHKAKLRIRELLAQTPEERPATAGEQRPSMAKPLFEDWDLAMAQGMGLQSQNLQELAGPIA